MNPSIQHLLAVSAVYAEATTLSRSSVSKRVFNDGKVLDNLASGADMTIGRHATAMQWLSDNWPEGAVWPEGIARPAKNEAAA